MVFFFLSSNPMFWVNKGPTRVQILLGSDGWKQNSKTSKSLGKTNKKCPPNCNSYFVVTRIKQIQTLQQKKKEKRKKHNTATCCVKLPCKTQINLVLEQQLNLVITQHKTKLKFWQFKKIYSLPTHKNSSPSLVKQKSHKICKKTCISVHKFFLYQRKTNLGITNHLRSQAHESILNPWKVWNPVHMVPS
jgi:hypothetical protein